MLNSLNQFLKNEKVFLFLIGYFVSTIIPFPVIGLILGIIIAIFNELYKITKDKSDGMAFASVALGTLIGYFRYLIF